MLKRRLTILLSALTMAFCVAGCGGKARQPVESTSSQQSSQIQSEFSSSSSSSSTYVQTHTVTFVSDGRVFGNPVVVNHGETVSEPEEVPTKQGNGQFTYEFEYWHLSTEDTAFNFSTPIVKNITLHSKFREIDSNPYSLVVFIHGVNAENSVLVTEEESNIALREFRSRSNLDNSVNISWNYSVGLTNYNFSEAVKNFEYPVDVVIASAACINNYVGYNPDYEYAPIEKGWFENASRRVAVTPQCSNRHLDLALELYTMLNNIGPNYSITLPVDTLRMRVGETTELYPTFYGNAPTWTVEDLNPAGCIFVNDNGLVRAIAAGTGKVVAIDDAGRRAVCAVTVVSKTSETLYDLSLVIQTSGESNSLIKEVDARKIIDRFTSTGQPGEGKDIGLYVINSTSAPEVVANINAINSIDGGDKVDAVIGTTSVLNSKSGPTVLSTYGIKTIEGTWKYNGGCYGIYENIPYSHLELAEALGTFLTEPNVDYFELEMSTITVDEGSTYQIETGLAGLSFASSNTGIFTVSETGLITGVSRGRATVSIINNAYYIEVKVIVNAINVDPDVINIYLNNAGTSTVYMSTENVEIFISAVEEEIPNSITVNWFVIDGRYEPEIGGTNRYFATYIKEITDILPDIVICGSGAIGTGYIVPHEDMPKQKITCYCGGSTRYVAGCANMPADHHDDALAVYNAILTVNAANQ